MKENGESLPITEQENPRSQNLSSLSAAEIVSLMNDEDATVATAVQQILVNIAAAVEQIVIRLRAGGKLFYIGTGTSGRLGVLDASECPPTFGVSPELVQGVIGVTMHVIRPLRHPKTMPSKQTRLSATRFGRGDALVGIAASGRTPYTVGALTYARSLGALTIAITCVLSRH